MKIKLESDFLDYYDHWFDGSDSNITFERMSTGGMSRREMFQFFADNGIKTPEFGQVTDIWNTIDKSLCNIVVYVNERAHRSECKILMKFGQSMQHARDCFASRHIPSRENERAVSERFLAIGDLFFWLKYSSDDFWRSNYGNVEIEIVPKTEYEKYPYIGFGLPLYAIDFVRSVDNILYAIDFNIAPQIKGTGIEDIVPARKVVYEIKKWMNILEKEQNMVKER